MSDREERITRAKLIDGKVMIEQADGSYREAEDRTDWARVDALTDEDIERMAKEDGDEAFLPEDEEPKPIARRVAPAK